MPPVTNVTGPDWEDRGWKDDGLGIGDYPNLPERSYQLRDPYGKYWDTQDRRNFGEPVSLNQLYIHFEELNWNILRTCKVDLSAK